jgi:hypothetical protein
VEKRICSKLWIALIIVGTVFLVTTAAALAATSSETALWQENDPTDPLDPTDPIDATEPITPNVPANAISLFFGVEVTKVVTLHDEGFGYGQISKAYFLSARLAELDTEMTPEAILAMRSEDGMGWGNMVMTLSVSYTLDLRPGKGAWGNLGGIISNTVRTADRIAAKLGEDSGEIQAMLEQGASPGAIAMAYKLAAQYDADPATVISLRLGLEDEKGLSWGQIKKDLRDSEDTTPTLSASQGNPQNQKNQGNRGQANKGDHGKGHGRGGGKKK